jgi:1,2-diacylglycerol 3-alpha-glucosyltransferase
MKILASSLTYPLPNGVTVSLNTAVDGFIDRNHELLVVGPKYQKEPFRPEHRIVSSSMITRGIGILIGKEERTFGIKAHREIENIAKEFNPDVYWLHSLTWSRNAFEDLMLKSKKPSVIFYHTLVEEYGRIYAGRIGAYTMRERSKKACNQADAIMTPSSFMKEKLKSYGVTKPIHIIPTGIDFNETCFTRKQLSEKFKIPLDSKILLYVGRVSKEKNLDVLIDAMQEIKESKLKAVLLVVGPGDIKEMQKKTKSNNIVFTGGLPKSETVKMYGASDAFVFSSKSETQGLVIGEAMFAGTPVIALDSPIQKEVYPESVAVVVRNEKDFPEAIIETLKNKQKTKLMSVRAKKFVKKNFSKKSMIDKQIKVFQELIK